MSELIKLSLGADMDELVKKLTANGLEALSLIYSSDTAPVDSRPALELAAFKSGHARVPRLENRITSCQLAAKCLSQDLGLTDRKSKKTMAEIFQAREVTAGPLIGYMRNDAGNGIRLIYAKFTFVFIVPFEHTHKYCLETTS